MLKRSCQTLQKKCEHGKHYGLIAFGCLLLLPIAGTKTPSSAPTGHDATMLQNYTGLYKPPIHAYVQRCAHAAVRTASFIVASSLHFGLNVGSRVS